MNQELKRIKDKDFTKIDQTLFENVSRTDNLNFTLTHLTEFQKYLMEQISALNNPSAKTNKDSKIADSLVKTFDNLKQSILKCSQIRQKASKTKFLQLKKQINQLKKVQSKFIKQIVDEKDKLFFKNKQDFEQVSYVIMQKYISQKQKNEQLQLKCIKYQSQLKQLKQEKYFLNTQIIQKQKILQFERSNYIVKQVQEKQPLRQIRANKENNIQTQFLSKKNSYENGLMLMRDQISNPNVSGYNSTQKSQQVVYHYHNTPIKRSNSNHRLPSKTHLTVLKDINSNSNMISKCDVIQNLKRGKSKQKIKLYSMF